MTTVGPPWDRRRASSPDRSRGPAGGRIANRQGLAAPVGGRRPGLGVIEAQDRRVQRWQLCSSLGSFVGFAPGFVVRHQLLQRLDGVNAFETEFRNRRDLRGLGRWHKPLELFKPVGYDMQFPDLRVVVLRLQDQKTPAIGRHVVR